MKQLLIVLLLFMSTTDPSDIAKRNRLKSKAETAFEHGQYEVAAANYSKLYDSLGMTDPSIGLNLAHCYYALNDSANARLKYQSVASSDHAKLKSIAYQQLGVMAKSPKTLKESLNYLKSALKADPTNEEARYNYEVVKKLIEDQKKQQDENKDNQDQNKDQKKKDQQDKDQQNKDQENKDQQNKDQQSKDQQEQGDKGEQDQQDQNQEKQDQESEKQDGKQGEQDKKPEDQEQQQQEGEQSEDEQNKDQQNQNMSTKQKLEQMNISEEKAKMILDAMKNNEIQFIQQQKRKATKSQDSGKPDW